MKKLPFLFWIVIGSFCTLFCCTRSNAYLKMEAEELAKDVRFDSLFFGLYLGMTSRDFFDRCWKLNKKGLIRQGATNTSVYYKITDFKYAAGMDFYPEFHENTILEMPITFSYDAWAPWNKSMHADSLKMEVLPLMEEWYGKGFLELKSSNKNKGTAYVKIDGNRRVSIYNLNDQVVKVDVLDLRRFKQIEAQLENVQ